MTRRKWGQVVLWMLIVLDSMKIQKWDVNVFAKYFNFVRHRKCLWGCMREQSVEKYFDKDEGGFKFECAGNDFVQVTLSWSANENILMRVRLYQRDKCTKVEKKIAVLLCCAGVHKLGPLASILFSFASIWNTETHNWQAHTHARKLGLGLHSSSPKDKKDAWQAQTALFISPMSSMNVPWGHNGKTIQAGGRTQTRVNREWVDLCFMGVRAVSYIAIGGLLLQELLLLCVIIPMLAVILWESLLVRETMGWWHVYMGPWVGCVVGAVCLNIVSLLIRQQVIT